MYTYIFIHTHMYMLYHTISESGGCTSCCTIECRSVSCYVTLCDAIIR